MENLVLRQNGKQTHITGKILVEAKDGGVVVMTPEGAIVIAQPGDIVERSTDELPYKPLTSGELSKKLLAELPPGFDTYSTAHYLICYNTSKAYAEWAGSLFERLYTAFTNFWKNRGVKLHDPDTPLVVLVFADHESYAKHAETEIGGLTKAIPGYYNVQTNRVTMHDLTGVEALRQAGDRRGSKEQINQMLSRPEAENLVSLVVHEATHQIAFNCGLQPRYSDTPVWVSEGLAVFFETPDLSNARGWSTIGAVNYGRLEDFQRFLPTRPSRSLESLLTQDARFRDPKQADAAYAEAWALTYFLVKQRQDAYVKYMKVLSQAGPPTGADPAGRLQQFKAAFGTDLNKLDADFLRFIEKIK